MLGHRIGLEGCLYLQPRYYSQVAKSRLSINENTQDILCFIYRTCAIIVRSRIIAAPSKKHANFCFLFHF